jgi:hypothetical protein
LHTYMFTLPLRDLSFTSLMRSATANPVSWSEVLNKALCQDVVWKLAIFLPSTRCHRPLPTKEVRGTNFINQIPFPLWIPISFHPLHAFNHPIKSSPYY